MEVEELQSRLWSKKERREVWVFVVMAERTALHRQLVGGYATCSSTNINYVSTHTKHAHKNTRKQQSCKKKEQNESGEFRR